MIRFWNILALSPPQQRLQTIVFNLFFIYHILLSYKINNIFFCNIFLKKIYLLL